jgi:2-keto-4-pentenoate hydratase
MSDHARVNRIAQHLYNAHDSRSKFENLAGELKPQSMIDAYEVQKTLNGLWSESGRGPIAGYKIALTSKAIQELVGVDKPVGAAVFASSIHLSPAIIHIDNFVRLGLEFELAFTISKDVPEKNIFDAASIVEFVDSAMPAFELIEDRAADYSDLDPMSLIADNAWCGGIVIGKPSKAWKQINLANAPVRLSYNDNEMENANTGAAMGNPLNSLAWLATLLSGQGRPLKAGDIVMSGSTLATKFAERGDRAVYEVAGLGSVEVRVD